MIKVLHITNAYPYPATPEYGVFIKEQIESLPKDAIISDVVFVNGREKGKRAYLNAIREVRSLLPRCDVIHCHHVYSFIVAVAAGAIFKRPVVLSFLNDWTREVKGIRFGLLREIVCRASVAFAARVIFKSPVPEKLRSSKKVINLPNGVDPDFFSVRSTAEARQELGLSPDINYLLFVSSKNKFREQKRYDIFRRTLDIVQELRPDLRTEEIVMVGQPRERIPTIFSAAAAHVLTSDYEGSPNSVKEALSCGTRVISRDVGNVREMLSGVPGTAVIDSNDPEDLARAVIDVLDNDVGKHLIRQAFLEKGITKQRVAQELVRIYAELQS